MRSTKALALVLRVEGLEPNASYRIREGDAAATPVERKPPIVGGR